MDGQFRFSFFLSEKAALSLISNKSFYNLVKKSLVDIYVDGNEGDIRSRMGNPVTSVRFINGRDIIRDIENEASFSDYPYSVFVLDVSPQEAARIQSESGVICQSSDDIKLDALFMHRYFVSKEGHPSGKNTIGKFYHTWDNIIERVLPCNCIIVNDKYLIKNANQELGIRNLETIIKNLRYNSNAKTDLVIVIEACDVKDSRGNVVISQSEQFGIMSEILSQRMGQDKLNIHCICPILPSDRENPWYRHIHNRRILTNYCMYSAEYRLCAFLPGSPSKESVDQLMTCYPLFSEGLAYNKSYVDQSEYSHRLFLSRFNNILYGDKQWRLYSFNGKVMGDVVDIPLIRMADRM